MADCIVRLGYRLVPTLVLAFLLTSCSKQSSVTRFAVSGKVTYQGKPVPRGFVCFTPNPQKGNRGPQGLARIVDGEFSTERNNGRGAVKGPQSVEIRGFQADVSPSGDTTPFANGPALFEPYTTEIDITEDSTTVDFVVPLNAATKK